MSCNGAVLAPEISKVKPYTVYDLSTRSVLSDEEITECLKEATQKEYLKKIGEYGLNDDLAKPNGDAPNFMLLPSKKRSKSFSALPTQYDTVTDKQDAYDALPFRVRSNTAPANYQLPASFKGYKKDLLKSSRLVQPSSPGSAKRKVQLKLQRDAKQQIAFPRNSNAGNSSPLVKQLSNSRIPNSKIAAPSSPSIPRHNGIASPPTNLPSNENPGIPTSKLIATETKRGISSPAGKRLAQPATRAQQTGLQRSIAPRLSQKNSDASSSDTNSDSSSCRSTPVSGGFSPLNGLTDAISNSSVASSSNESITTKQTSGIPFKKGIPTRASSALENKRSLDSLRMSRENTAENFAKRKISSSTIPRGKQSCESLQRENTADSIRKPKSGARRSSVGSFNGDQPLEKTTLAATYGKLSYSSSTSKIKTVNTTSTESISRTSASTDSLQKLRYGTSSTTKSSTDCVYKLKTSSKNLSPSPVTDTSAITVNVSELDLTDKLSTHIRIPSKSKIKAPGSKVSPKRIPSVTTSRSSALKPPTGSYLNKHTSNTTTKLSETQSINSKYNSDTVQKTSPKPVQLQDTLTEKRRASDGSVLKNSNKTMLSEDSQPGRKDQEELRYPTIGRISQGLSASSAISKLPTMSSSSNDEDIKLTQNTSNVIKDKTKELVEKDLEKLNLYIEKQSIDDTRERVDFDYNLHSSDYKFNSKCTPSRSIDSSSDSSNTSTPSPLYKLDIPSPEGDGISSIYNVDSISYPYDSQKLTHQNVELIISDRIQSVNRSSEANNIKITSDDYAEPADRVKVNMNGYEIPLDTISNDGNDDADDDYLSHEDDRHDVLNGSKQSVINTIHDPFEMNIRHHLNNDIDRIASPFKHIQQKLYIPPPQLNSVSAEGGLAPVPNEYMRTPSTDVEDVVKYSFEIDDIRKKAHQEAVKAWKNKNLVREEEDDGNRHDATWEDGMMDMRERLDTDVFYPTSDGKDQGDKFAMRTSVRRASEENIPQSMTGNNEDSYQLQTMTLGRDKKKKSKIKKFFQKLSSKKDGKEEFDILEIGRPTIEDFRTSISSYTSNIKTRHYSHDSRRKSDGTISLHSIHDSFSINATPSSKRRYLFNLNFLKKGRRQRSQTYGGDGRHLTDYQRPSATVRALCSPDVDRRNRIIQTRLERRDSEPTLYRVNQRLSQTEQTLERGVNQPLRSSKKYKAPQPPSSIPPYAEVTFRPRVSNSSISSNDDEASYINYPFSKSNISPPKKPERQRSKGSCSETTEHRSRSTSNSTQSSKKSNEGSETWKKDFETAVENLNKSSRLSSDSSNSSSALSSESLSSSQRSNTLTIEASYKTPQKRQSTSSLRRTPLRHSIDSYNKLIEVHRQTIEKIAYETSRLTCNCETVQKRDWDGFESNGEHIQLGLTSFMVAPVLLKQDELTDTQQRKYTAWLQLNQPQSQCTPSEYLSINYSASTLHRNCLHICHTIEQDTSQHDTSQQNDLMPKAIQIKNVFISPQIPKMTLNKYASLTLEKHSRYPEMYEKEVAMILLQIVKGIQHFYRQGVFMSSIQTENIFILHNGEQSVTLSPRRQPNKCPAIAVGILPTLGNSFEKSEYTSMTNLCHQLAFLLYELLHTPYHDELKDAIDISMLLATLPDLTIKSVYSRYLQHVINMLLGSSEHVSKTFDDLRLILEVILFGPTDISDHNEDDAIVLINKWHNRRCVDMVTHILKEASLIVLCASNVGQDMEKMKGVEQELLLECEFLADATASDIYRIAKLLNR